MSDQIHSFDAAFSECSPGVSAGAPGAGTSDPALFYGIGAQFAVHSSGLSGAQRKVKHKKVCFEASGRDRMTSADSQQW